MYLSFFSQLNCILFVGAQQIRAIHKSVGKMTAAAPKVAAVTATTGTISASPLGRLWRRYLTFTDAHPIPTQAVTAIFCAGLGNFISQTVVERRSLRNIDWPSVVKFMAISACVTFPIIRSWFWTLERVIKPGRFAALKKVTIDQLLFAPLFLASFIVLMGCVEGSGWQDAKERLSHVSVFFPNNRPFSFHL